MQILESYFAANFYALYIYLESYYIILILELLPSPNPHNVRYPNLTLTLSKYSSIRVIAIGAIGNCECRLFACFPIIKKLSSLPNIFKLNTNIKWLVGLSIDAASSTHQNHNPGTQHPKCQIYNI